LVDYISCWCINLYLGGCLMKFNKKGDITENIHGDIEEEFNIETTEIAIDSTGKVLTRGKAYSGKETLDSVNTSQIGRWLAPKPCTTILGHKRRIDNTVQPFRALNQLRNFNTNIFSEVKLSDAPHLSVGDTTIINIKFMYNFMNTGNTIEPVIFAIGGVYDTNPTLAVSFFNDRMDVWFTDNTDRNSLRITVDPTENVWREYECQIDRSDVSNCFVKVDGVVVPGPESTYVLNSTIGTLTGDLSHMDMVNDSTSKAITFFNKTMLSTAGLLIGSIANLKITYDNNIVGYWKLNEAHENVTIGDTVAYKDSSMYGVNIISGYGDNTLVLDDPELIGKNEDNLPTDKFIGRQVQPFRALQHYRNVETWSPSPEIDLINAPHLDVGISQVVNIKFTHNAQKSGDRAIMGIIHIGGNYYSTTNTYISVQAQDSLFLLWIHDGSGVIKNITVPYDNTNDVWHDYEFQFDRLVIGNCFIKVDGVAKHNTVASVYSTILDMDMINLGGSGKLNIFEGVAGTPAGRGTAGAICNVELKYDDKIVGSWGFNEDLSSVQANPSQHLRFWDSSKYAVHFDHNLDTTHDETTLPEIGTPNYAAVINGNAYVSYDKNLVKKSWSNTRGYTKALYNGRRNIDDTNYETGIRQGFLPASDDWVYEFDFKMFGIGDGGRIFSNLRNNLNNHYINVGFAEDNTDMENKRILKLTVRADSGDAEISCQVSSQAPRNIWRHLKIERSGLIMTMTLEGVGSSLNLPTGFEFSSNDLRLAGIYSGTNMLFKIIETNNPNSTINYSILPIFNYTSTKEPKQDIGTNSIQKHSTVWGSGKSESVLTGNLLLAADQQARYGNSIITKTINGPYSGPFKFTLPRGGFDYNEYIELYADYSGDAVPAQISNVAIHKYTKATNLYSPLLGDYVGSIFRSQPYDLSDLGNVANSSAEVINEGAWSITAPSYIGTSQSQSYYDLNVGDGLYLKGEATHYNGAYIISKSQHYNWDGWTLFCSSTGVQFRLRNSSGNTDEKQLIYNTTDIDITKSFTFEYYVDPLVGLVTAIVNGVDVMADTMFNLWDPSVAASTPEELMIGRQHSQANYNGLIKRIQFGKSSSNILLDTNDISTINPSLHWDNSGSLPFQLNQSRLNAVLKQDYVLSINGSVGGGTAVFANTNQALHINTNQNDYTYEWKMRTDVDHAGGSFKTVFSTHKTTHNTTGTNEGIQVQHHFSSVFRIMKKGGSTGSDSNFKAFNFTITDVDMRGTHSFKILETHDNNGDVLFKLWMDEVELTLLSAVVHGDYTELDYNFSDHIIRFWGDSTWGAWGGTDTSLWDFKITEGNILKHYFPMTGYPEGDIFHDVVGSLVGKVINGNTATNFLRRDESNFYNLHRGYTKEIDGSHTPARIEADGKNIYGIPLTYDPETLTYETLELPESTGLPIGNRTVSKNSLSTRRLVLNKLEEIETYPLPLRPARFKVFSLNYGAWTVVTTATESIITITEVPSSKVGISFPDYAPTAAWNIQMDIKIISSGTVTGDAGYLSANSSSINAADTVNITTGFTSISTGFPVGNYPVDNYCSLILSDVSVGDVITIKNEVVV
jgi:hypothetical protein